MSFSKSEKKEIAGLIREELRKVGLPQKETAAYTIVGEEKPQVWGENVKCLELKCGLRIAMEDYWELDENGDKKTEFSQEEAIAIKEKTGGKWRVPTMAEWAQILEELGMKNGEVDRDTFVKALDLTENECGGGRYWSSTVATPSTNGYYLNFFSGGVWPANQFYRYDGRSVRCVAE